MLALAFLISISSAFAAKPRQHIRPSRERVVRNLNHGLARSPMAGTGRELEAAGFAFHISPYFIAGIAATESSLGAAACSGNPKNAFGLSSCTTGWAVPYFKTWAAAYNYMGRFLSSRWPGARTPYDLWGYAADSTSWGNSTSRHMMELFGVSNETRYGATSVVA